MTSIVASLDAELAELLRLSSLGDTKAFEEFYDATSARAYGLALRVLRDPGLSQDAVQDAYLQAWRAASRHDPTRGSVMSWLLTIVHRRAVDRVRSSEAARRRELAAAADESTTTPIGTDEVVERVEANESRVVIDRCLQQLTDLQRQSISMAYFDGLSYSQVAAELEVALPTVKSRIRDGLRRMRDCIGRHQ